MSSSTVKPKRKNRAKKTSHPHVCSRTWEDYVDCRECDFCKNCFAKMEAETEDAFIDQLAHILPQTIKEVCEVLNDLHEHPPCILDRIMDDIANGADTCVTAMMVNMGVRYLPNGLLGWFEQYCKPDYMTQEEYDSYKEPDNN